MNEINKVKQEGKPMDLSVELEKIINKAIDRVEAEVPDKGYFRSFAVNINPKVKTNIFAKNIALFIERDEEREGRAFLGVSVLHPAMSLDASNYFMNGDRKEIVEFLKNPDFKNVLNDRILALSESLKNK